MLLLLLLLLLLLVALIALVLVVALVLLVLLVECFLGVFDYLSHGFLQTVGPRYQGVALAELGSLRTIMATILLSKID